MRPRQAPDIPSIAFGWELLPRVSRSFAFVTRHLHEGCGTDLGAAVMVFYLVCRVLDTIEDSLLPQDEKRALYRRFLAALDGHAEPDLLFPDAARLTDHDGYRDLLVGASRVRDAFASFAAPVRAIILRYATEMAEGMDAFGDRPILTFDDLDAYCHPVAVVVGYGLTELFAHFGHIPPAGPDDFARARHFGLCLQKVNITRDYGQDHVQGRHFWPLEVLSRRGLDYDTVVARHDSAEAMAALEEMLANVRPDLDGALAYLLRIPPRETALRMFCAVSLVLALLTLERVRANPEVFSTDAQAAPDSSLKVSRADFMELVAALEAMAGDDAALRQAYDEALARLFA